MSEATMSEAEAVAAIVEEQKLAELVQLSSGVQLLVTRGLAGDTQAHSTKRFGDEYLDKPERKRGVAALTTLESFIEHVNREKLEHSAVFLNDLGQPHITAVYDYQAPGAGDPSFHEHMARYAFPLSDEWKAWTGLSGRMISQTDFAEFLEDHLTDVVDLSTINNRADVDALEQATGGSCATPQQLLEVSRGLKISSRYEYQNHETLSSGETQFQFQNTHTASNKGGQPITVPTCFVVAIPVFRSGAVYPTAVKLRYRVEDGVKWGFTLYKPEKRIEDALAEAAGLVAAKTDLPVFYGTPEQNPKP